MKNIEIETLQEVRLNGIDIGAGEVVEVEETLASTWFKHGLARLPEKEKSKENDKKPINTTPDNQEDIQKKLKPSGIGYYELPNGEKIKGKKAAMEALIALEGGEQNGLQTETSGLQNEDGNSTDSGTDNTAGSKDSSENIDK